MKTPESIAEKLQRKDYDVDFDTAVTALNDISGVRCICYSVKEIYWIARQIGKTDTYTVVKAKDYIRKPKKMGMRVTISFWISRCLTKERQLWFVWNCSCGR